MWIISIISIAIVARGISGKPQPPHKLLLPPDESGPNTTPIPIISQTESSNPDGSFNFSFETGNGIRTEESGYQKPNANSKPGDGEETIQVLSGSYSYTAPDGAAINLRYVADENGFKATGDHLPTPPPIPEEIRQSLSLLPQNVPDSEIAAPKP